jgi:hypothetical protein
MGKFRGVIDRLLLLNFSSVTVLNNPLIEVLEFVVKFSSTWEKVLLLWQCIMIYHNLV